MKAIPKGTKRMSLNRIIFRAPKKEWFKLEPKASRAADMKKKGDNPMTKIHDEGAVKIKIDLKWSFEGILVK